MPYLWELLDAILLQNKIKLVCQKTTHSLDQLVQRERQKLDLVTFHYYIALKISHSPIGIYSVLDTGLVVTLTPP